MRVKLIWAVIFIVGVAIASWATIIVADISLTQKRVDVTTDAVYNEVPIVESNAILATNGSSIVLHCYKAIDISYLEFKIENLNKKSSVISVDYSENGIDFENVTSFFSDGRNFISLPKGNYMELRLWFEEGTSFNVRTLALIDGMPLRYRYIGVFMVVSVFWAWICFRSAKRNNIFYAQVANLRRHSYMLFNLVRKDFALKYRRSVLGILWSVLNPLMMMAIISTVFSQVFRMQMEHYAVYYLTGSFIFGFMSEATMGSLSSVVGSSALIKKVYVPKYIFPIERCLFALLNSMFSFVAILILMPILGVPLGWKLLLAWIPMLYTLVFSIGLGMILAAGNVFFRDIGHLYSVWISAWMYLTPILYPVDLLPKKVRWFVEFNPIYHFVTYFRELVMYNSIPDLRLNLICIAYAFAFITIGILVFERSQDKFIIYI